MRRLVFYIFVAVSSATFSDDLFALAPVISYSPSTNVYSVGTAITTLTPSVTNGVTGFGFGTATALTGATLNGPRGVAIDPSGNIYVTNSGNNTVSKYNSSGTYVGTFGSGIAMSQPINIAFDSFGNAYVLNLGASAGSGSVFKYNSAGVYQSTIISGINSAYGLTIDASNNIYITDQGATTVKKYSTAGALLLSLPTTNLSTPNGVAVDASDNIYVLNNGTGNVTKYNSAGVFQSTFLSGFMYAQAITIDGAGNIYVCANGTTDAIYVYNLSGTLLTTRTAVNSQGIDVDIKGDIFVANNTANLMNEYKPTGGFFLSGSLPAGLSFDSTTGNISGTPTATMATTVYTITAYNASGSGNTTVTLTVNAAPTAPTGSGGSACASGAITLAASGSTPAGGVYTWYAAFSGGGSLGTGGTYTTPTITATTTYYVDYTVNGATTTPRTAVTATINAAPVLSTAPTSPTAGLYLSYPFTGNANDVSGNSNNGTLQNAPTLTTDRYGAANSAYSFNGTTQYVSTATNIASPGPQNFSISVWFKTSSAGGKLVGFGSSQTGSSVSNDRNIYMSNSGQIYFTLYPGAVKIIKTVASYGDGNWHHVVATESTTNGANLYVDGVLQATDATMNTSQSYAGYWRIGYDNTAGWLNAPTSYYFNGSLDDIAIYNSELTQAQVFVLYGAGGGLFCAGNTFSLTANTVAGATYSWSGPGGFSSSSQNPSVSNAVAGTYTLVVTSASGCSSTINVTAPSNVITSTWTGGAGTANPAAAGNWDQLPVFNNLSNLVIPGGLTFYPSLTANESIYGLTIASGASLNLNGFTLSVACNIYNSSGGQILYGSSNNSGITWNGSASSQTFTGSSTSNTAQFGTMTVNNTVNGTVTISGGPVDIYNTLTITQGNLAVGASPAALTLKSTATQSASVAAVPAGSSITGTVNVERYLTGGAGYRGYRLLSSPVYGSTVNSNNVYSVNYLKNSSYLTGTTGIAGGFDKTGNPTLFLYRENLAPSSVSFISGNFRGINTIGTAPNYGYLIDGDPGTFNIPVGNGFLFFFRGDKSVTTLAAETIITYVPTNITLTTSGTLNTGQIIVKDWYTPASSTLGWTTGTANTAVRGFNLIGNPYASSIDWEQYNTTTTTTGIYTNNIGTTIYELNPLTKNFDTYQKGGVHTNNGSKTIASGQGFFVVATCSCAQVIFNESAKTTTQNTGLNLFMATRADIATVSNTNSDQYLRLQLTKDSIDKDDTYIGFNSSAQTQYVFNEDAPYKTGTGMVRLASISSDNEALAINKQPLPKQTETIGLKVIAMADGIYSLNMTEIKSVPQIYDIWLIDHYKKDSSDMRHNANYAFNIYRADTNSYGSARFQLVIRQNPAFAVHLLDFTAVKSTNGSQIAWKTENEENYTHFTVERSTDNGMTFDILGGFSSDAHGTYSFLDAKPLRGVNQYRLKQEDMNGTISYSKVVPLMYSGLSNNIVGNAVSIYPNPASSTIYLIVNQGNRTTSLANFSTLQMQSLAPGLVSTPASYASQSYNIKIISITGTVIVAETSLNSFWQKNINNLLPGTYIIEVLNNSDKSLVGKSTFIKL